MRQLPNRQKKYFNPRSHEGSDILLNYPRRDSMISIRAPTKGATYEKIVKSFITKISIHAPTKGATSQALFLGCHWEISIHAPTKGATFFFIVFIKFLLFQSTLPRRERRYTLAVDRRFKRISIHAPTKGATQIARFEEEKLLFQSTLPRRERPFL